MTFVLIISAVAVQLLLAEILTATPISILPYPSDTETIFDSNFQLGGQFISPAFTQPIDLANPFSNLLSLANPDLTNPVQFSGGVNVAVSPSSSSLSARMLTKPGMTKPAVVSTKPGMTKPAQLAMKPGMVKPMHVDTGDQPVTDKTIVPVITIPFGL